MEEGVLLCNGLYERVLQSYYAIIIVIFNVLSNHVRVLTYQYDYHCSSHEKRISKSESFDIRLDGEEIKTS